MTDDARGRGAGLPAEGPGSAAGFGRRMVALALDWAVSTLVALLVVPDLTYPSSRSSTATLGVFTLEVFLLTWLGGASFGQRVLRIRVVGLGRRLGVVASLLRTVLIVFVVPPLIYDSDGRGLHDKAVSSVVVHA